MEKLHKNWQAICAIGKTGHTLIMLMIATLDMDKYLQDMYVSRVVELFPECFSKTAPAPVGRIPLSALRAFAAAAAKEERSDSEEACSGAYIESFKIHKMFEITIIMFSTGRESLTYREALPLPTDINLSTTTQGSLIDFHGHDYVVLERNDNCDTLVVAPITRVDPEL